MARVRLCFPNGVGIQDPDMAVVAKMLNEPDSYFTPDSCGEAAIEYKSQEIETAIGIRHVGGKNFSIEWCMVEGPCVVDSASIILPGILNAETVETYVGGTPLQLPQASVISNDDALSIVTSFCKDGYVSGDWNPVRLSKLPPDVYYWGDTSK